MRMPAYDFFRMQLHLHVTAAFICYLCYSRDAKLRNIQREFVSLRE